MTVEFRNLTTGNNLILTANHQPPNEIYLLDD